MADKIKNGKMENDINDETLCAEYAAVYRYCSTN